MAVRGTFDTGPGACPFVALELDRDRRSERPDYRHRCYAEQVPAPRTIAHQERYCLSPNFAGCPIFQDWAVRAAARPVPLPPGYEGRRAAPAPSAAIATNSEPVPDQQWPDSMDEPPPTSLPVDEADEPAVAQQLSAFDAAPAAPPPGSGVGFAALTAPDPLPEIEAEVVPVERVGGDVPLEPDLADEPHEAPVPAFLAGRSSRPRSSPEVVEQVAREDVVPSWEISDRYGAQAGDREPRSSGLFGRLLTIAAVVIILALGVATVILVPGLLSSPGATTRPSFATLPSRSPASPGASAVGALPTPTVPSPSPSGSVEPTPEVTPEVTPEPSPRTYRIKSGDTLARIARRFRVSIDEILAANPQISNPDQIQVGQVIVIPSGDGT